MDSQFAEDVIDFFISNEGIAHMGDGKGGFGRLTGPDKVSRKALAEFYGRLSKEFQFTPAQKNHWWLAFEALQDEKTRKECLASLKEDKAQACGELSTGEYHAQYERSSGWVWRTGSPAGRGYPGLGLPPIPP